jgi:hypothetical protein
LPRSKRIISTSPNRKENPQLGFMLELRDQIGSEYAATVHFWTIRLGIAIRGKSYD